VTGKTYTCTIEVRGYELDSFGHLNHAMYVSYLEHARWKLLEEENIRLADFNRWQRWPVIARIEVDYLKPTFMGESLEVRTQTVEAGRTSFIAEQAIFRGDTQVLKAKVHVVMVNEKGRPAELPEEVSRLSKGQVPDL
jgi:YbgC/YbaW family acyl-CoA thioester hydrolase